MQDSKLTLIFDTTAATTCQNSQTLWKLQVVSKRRNIGRIVGQWAHPSFVVQIPIMPQSGIMIVTTFVTTNCKMCDSSMLAHATHEKKKTTNYHFLRTNPPIPLYVPKPKSTHSRCNSLRKTKIRVIQERKLELIVLTDRDKCTSRIESL